jgi:hypothetical protein
VTITAALQNKTKQVLPQGQEKILAQMHPSMTWAQRLKQVFNIDIEIFEQCGGAVKDIASIEELVLISTDCQLLEYKKWQSCRTTTLSKSGSASDNSVCIKAVYHQKKYSELFCKTAGSACIGC